MRLVLAVFLLSGFALAIAQPKEEETRQEDVRFINPATLSAPSGYTHMVSAAGGRTVYIAGQVALDNKGNVVGQGDLRAETKQVFEKLKTALTAAGATFDNVAKLNYYIMDFSQLPGGARDPQRVREPEAPACLDCGGGHAAGERRIPH